MRRLFLLLVLVLLGTASAWACTGVVIARDGQAIVGGNEDWQRWDSWMWAEPARGNVYGVVYFGYEVRGEFGDRPDHWVEFQGVNDQGLYFDSFGAPASGGSLEDAQKPRLDGHPGRLIMQWCATVEEAVAMLMQYSAASLGGNQYLIADRTGAAAVVGGGTVTWKTGDTFVLTNFLPSDPTLGGWPCWRYDRAIRLLEEDADATVERVSEILDAAHLPHTRYSVVCDLVAETATLYFGANFGRSAVVDVAELCRVGSDRVSIPSLIEAGG